MRRVRGGAGAKGARLEGDGVSSQQREQRAALLIFRGRWRQRKPSGPFLSSSAQFGSTQPPVLDEKGRPIGMKYILLGFWATGLNMAKTYQQGDDY